MDSIGLLVEAANHPDVGLFRSELQNQLAALAGCDECFVVPFGHDWAASAPDYLRAFDADPGMQQLLPKMLREAFASGSFIDTELFSKRDRDRSPFYAQWFRPRQLTSQLVQFLSFGGRPLGVAHLNRHGRSRPFVERDRNAIAPLGRLGGALLSARHQFRQQDSLSERLSVLSERERRVAKLAAEGFENVQIAAHLGISAHTVRNHLYVIFKKLGIFSRVDLARSLSGLSSTVELPMPLQSHLAML